MRRAQAAAAAGCDPETVRFYEAKGLLPPPARSPAGHRLYDAHEIDRLRFVCEARRLGFPLDKVRTLLDALDGRARCGAVRAETEALLDDVRARRAALDALEHRLSGLLRACGDPDDACAMVDLVADPDRTPSR